MDRSLQRNGTWFKYCDTRDLHREIMGAGAQSSDIFEYFTACSKSFRAAWTAARILKIRQVISPSYVATKRFMCSYAISASRKLSSGAVARTNAILRQATQECFPPCSSRVSLSLSALVKSPSAKWQTDLHQINPGSSSSILSNACRAKLYR